MIGSVLGLRTRLEHLLRLSLVLVFTVGGWGGLLPPPLSFVHSFGLLLSLSFDVVFPLPFRFGFFSLLFSFLRRFLLCCRSGFLSLPLICFLSRFPCFFSFPVHFLFESPLLLFCRFSFLCLLSCFFLFLMQRSLLFNFLFQLLFLFSLFFELPLLLLIVSPLLVFFPLQSFFFLTFSLPFLLPFLLRFFSFLVFNFPFLRLQLFALLLFFLRLFPLFLVGWFVAIIRLASFIFAFSFSFLLHGIYNLFRFLLKLLGFSGSFFSRRFRFWR